MRFRLLIAGALSALLLLGSCGAALAKDHHRGFGDLGEAPWAQSAITMLAAQGLVRGFTATQFGPQRPITVGQLAVILMRYRGVVQGSESMSAQEDAAVRSGLTQGMGRVTLAEDATRGQAVAMIADALHLQGPGTGAEMRLLARFHDAGRVPGWAKKPFALAVRLGLLEGSAGNLLPGSNITRAQLAVILQRIENTLGMSQTAQATTVRGSFQGSGSITSSSGQSQTTITLGVYGGGGQTATLETLDVAPGAQIFYGNQTQSSLASFKVGDSVFVTLDQSGAASVIVDMQGLSVPPVQRSSVFGSVYAIAQGSIQINVQGRGDDHGEGNQQAQGLQTFSLSPSAAAVEGGVQAGVSTVQPGDLVRLVFDQSGDVSLIIVRAQAQTASGTVLLAREDWLALLTSQGLVRVVASDRTAITLNGQPARLRQIGPGDQVTATGLSGGGGLAAQTITAVGAPIPLHGDH